MSYTPKGYQEIFLDYLQDAYFKGLLSDESTFVDDVTGRNQNIENSIVLELSVHASRIAEYYSQLSIIRNEQNIALANMDGLIIMGQMYFDPFPADYAVTEVTFSIDTPKADNITVEMGTQLLSKTFNNILFYTLDEAVILAGQTSVTVDVRCNTIGPIGNVGAGDIYEFELPNQLIDTVTNIYSATGGINAETMEAYRTRLLLWKYIIPKGTYDAVVNALKGVSSLGSYFIEQYWDGYGSTKIIVDPPTQYNVTAVETVINNVKAIDEDIIIVPVENIPIDVSCVVNISIDQTVAPTQSMKDRIELLTEQVLKRYIDGGTNADGTPRGDIGIGTDFVAFKAGIYIANQIPEVESVDFDFPKTITIESHERATAGNITVTVV